ncbi:MAG TPA: VWA domain-containing protein [Chloroflexia bacterium]|jgi:Ca-activated chloride channel family protein
MTALSLKATWNYDPLPALDQTSLAYVLVDINEEQAAGGAQPNSALSPQSSSLNLSLVLDTSGSMGGAKLQNLKQAVNWLVDHLSEGDTLAITLFDDEVHPLVGSTTLQDRAALHAQIDGIHEAGGTAMSKGLLVGLDEAIKGRKEGVVSRIVVLTDGQTWGDAERCEQLARQAGAAGIPITALGIGAEEDWSIELLDSLATESGGDSGYIAKPEEIAGAFEETLSAMQATTYQHLRLTFNPAGGVQPRAIYRVAPIISRLWPAQGAAQDGEGASATPQTDGAATAITLPLGDLQPGAGQTLLYELVLPARKPGQYRLAHLLLEYEQAGGATGRQDTALDLVVSFVSGAAKGPGDPRVMNHVERATTFKLQTRALQASMVGDVAGATRNLQAVATRLLNMGETELAEQAQREAVRVEQQGSMSAAGTKKLAYDTRKLSVNETMILRDSET